MFADRAKVFIKSGKGGDGHVSFRRELYVPNGYFAASCRTFAANDISCPPPPVIF